MSFSFESICSVALSFRGIPYRELVGSAKFNYSADSPSTTRMYISDWKNAEALAQALIGRMEPTSSTTQQWEPPHTDPERPQLYALSVSGEGIGNVGQAVGTGEIVYDMAILTVEYGILPGGGDTAGSGRGIPITFITERRDSAAAFVTLPKKKWLWQEGAKKGEAVGDDIDLHQAVLRSKISVVIHWWLNAPLDLTFENRLGTVNKENFRILQTIYPKGTLRFDHTARSRQWTSAGLQAWQVTQKFTWQKELWNTKQDPDSEEYLLVGLESGKTIHEEANFNVLFPS